jgi:hypothetical protein
VENSFGRRGGNCGKTDCDDDDDDNDADADAMNFCVL